MSRIENEPGFLEHIENLDYIQKFGKKGSIEQEVFMASEKDCNPVLRTRPLVTVVKAEIKKKYLISAKGETEPASKRSFIRLFKRNGRKCASATITPEEYLYAQERGLTLSIDDAPTARAIGIIGKSLHDEEFAEHVWGMKTSLSIEKNQIRKNIVTRLRLVQVAERAHGASIAELKDALTEYIESIERELLPLEYKLKEETHDPLQHLNTARLVMYLQNDKKHAEQLLKHLKSLSTSTIKGQSSGTGYDETRDIVANFIKNTFANVIRDAREANEHLSIAGGQLAIFRGRLNRALSDAETEIREYARFDQNMAIRKKHQGIYSTERITLLSEMGSSKAALEKFLYVINAAITKGNGKDSTPSSDNPVTANSYFNHKYFYWLRQFWSPNLAGETHLKSYYEMCSFFKSPWYDFIFFDNLKELGGMLWNSLKSTPEALYNIAYDLWEQFREDFYWGDYLRIAQNPETQLTDKKKLFTPPTEEKDDAFDNKSAPLACAPYPLIAFRLDDALSKLMEGGDVFYNFITRYYEISPHIAMYASLVYLLSGAAVLQPELLTQISASFKFINTWSALTAEAISKSQLSQTVSAAFTNFKELLLTLDAIADGENSTLATLAVQMKTNLGKAILGGGLIVAGGYALCELPVLGHHLLADAGTATPVEPSFLAAKLGVAGYESVAGEKHKASLASRTIKLLLQIALWPLRLLLMPINLIGKFIYDLPMPESYCSSWKPVLSPLIDAFKFIKYGGLHLADILIRIAILLGRSVKIVTKLLSDVLINGLATLINRPLSLLLATGALLTCVFLFPAGGPILFIAATYAGALLGGLLTINIYKKFNVNLTLHKPAAWLITKKHALYHVFHTCLTQPLRAFSQKFLNLIARSLTREKTILGAHRASNEKLFYLVENAIRQQQIILGSYTIPKREPTLPASSSAPPFAATRADASNWHPPATISDAASSIITTEASDSHTPSGSGLVAAAVAAGMFATPAPHAATAALAHPKDTGAGVGGLRISVERRP